MLTTASLVAGIHAVTAVYSGDSDFTSSTSQTISTLARANIEGIAGGLAVDSADDVFWADGNDVFEVRSDGVIIQVAGDGDAGYSGDGGPATAATLNLGLFTFYFGGGVAVDSAGDLFIADSGNNVVREVRPDGIITTVAGDGMAGYSGDGGPAVAAMLNYPADVAVDSAGDLFIVDSNNNVVREVQPDGIITTVAGDGAPVSCSATGGQLPLPNSTSLLAWRWTAQGDLFIADNSDVRKVGPDGIISTLVGGYTPTYLAVDKRGDLFFADFSYGYLWMLSPDLALSPVAVPVTDAQGVAIDNSGDVFVVDDGSHQVLELADLLCASNR